MASSPPTGPFQMHPDSFHIRPIMIEDLDAVLRVQAECYGAAMREPAPIVRARIGQAGDTAFVAVSGGRVLGYVFAYRSTLGKVTPLGAHFAPACAPDTLYLHDLAVSPQAAGLGLASRLARHVEALAQSEALPWCALVSVQASQGFWERLGYRATACACPEAHAALASYPPVAVYMTRRA